MSTPASKACIAKLFLPTVTANKIGSFLISFRRKAPASEVRHPVDRMKLKMGLCFIDIFSRVC